MHKLFLCCTQHRLGGMLLDKPRIATWNWRIFFDPSTIDLANKQHRAGLLSRFSINRTEGLSATAEFTMGYRCKCRAPLNYTQCLQEFYVNPELSPAEIQEKGRQFFTCNCSDSQTKSCVHEAVLLVHWEKERGSFTFRETTEEKARREAEEARRSLLVSRAPAAIPSVRTVPAQRPVTTVPEAEQPQPVAQFFQYLSIPEHLYYDPTSFLKTATVKPAVLEEAQKLFIAHKEPLKEILTTSQTYSATKQHINFKVSVGTVQVRIAMDHTGLKKCTCSQCHINWTQSKAQPFPSPCAHLLVGLYRALEYLIRYRPGDATNEDADLLMREIMLQQETAQSIALPANVELSHMIQGGDGRGLYYQVRFRLGKNLYHEMSRPLRLPDMIRNRELVYLNEGAVDFSRCTVTESSYPVLDLIENMRDAITRESMARGLSEADASFAIPVLSGYCLDLFYDAACGTDVPYFNMDGTIVGYVHVGPTDGIIQLILSLTEKEDQTVLLLEGRLPTILAGSQHDYIACTNPRSLSRVETEDRKIVSLIRRLGGAGSYLNCAIGESQMMHFVYDVLPALRANHLISIRDCTPEFFLDTVPTSVKPTFYLTRDKKFFHCRIVMTYGEKDYTLPYRDAFPPFRDIYHEEVSTKTVQRYFPQLDEMRQEYLCNMTDDNFYIILHDAVPEMERYGRVFASEDFPDLHIRKLGPMRFEIGVESNLLDISLISDELTQAELLEIFDAYKHKEHFHRLRSGDFIDLDEAREQMETLLGIAEQMDALPEDLIARTAHMPKARAYLLDAILQTHRNLVLDRDDNLQRMIDDFEKARSTVWEVPESLKNVMRPYQIAGYSWMRMLVSGGFGGILADDMGLGKTIQMLSLLLKLRQEGRKDPFLIVCPASLVYNWKEEIRRFTPQLTATTLTGTAPIREEILNTLKSGTKDITDIYIASYDICRRDIFSLRDIHFDVVVLDEAQYIKTIKANVTKAVKILDATYRFALTGTPIENRLSELWSIFDFLMPGFLFSETTFREQYDIPITQLKDPETTELLARMTAPFILRRLKTDVLKDLPEKLEEVRTAVLPPVQRNLYDAEVTRLKMHLSHSDDNPQQRMQILADLTRLRQVCCDPSLVYENYDGESAKRNACMDLVESAIDGGHRLLIFSQFTSMLDLLRQDLLERDIPYFILTGSTPKEERIRLVHDFNVGDTPVFLISLKAGGTGLNLTGADVVIHYDPWWNLAAQNQATDRAHRIGQKRQVTVFKLIAAGTIEERIVELQEQKKDLANAILEGRNESLLTLSREELMSLIS